MRTRLQRVTQGMYGVVCLAFWEFVSLVLPTVKTVGGYWAEQPSAYWAPMVAFILVVGGAMFGIGGAYLNRYVLASPARTVAYGIGFCVAAVNDVVRHAISNGTWHPLVFIIMWLSLASALYYLFYSVTDTDEEHAEKFLLAHREPY